jgi:hypothetical protein
MPHFNDTSESSSESTTLSKNSSNGPGGPPNLPEPTPLDVLMVSAAVVTVWPVVLPYIHQGIEWGILVLQWLRGHI